MIRLHHFCILFLAVCILYSCQKNDDGTSPLPVPGDSLQLAYPDSVFYITNPQEDYLVRPATARMGTYYAFPQGLQINDKTGEVNVTKSEGGLKYLISFIPDGKKDTLRTYITIAGINYLDGFYNLSTADSLALPIYNARLNETIPGINNGTLFDIGSGCNNLGCNVIPENGVINLAQTVRNGVFGTSPANNDRHEFELVYQVNDPSHRSLQKLKVKLYYYETMQDVTPEAFDIIASREGTILDPALPPPPMPLQLAAAKPRPPCIFIVGR